MASHGGDFSVASLFLRNETLPKRKLGVYHIHANDEVDLGRKHINRAWGIDEPTISAHHLRFRCVMFEEEDEVKVPPLIYARVLSRNTVALVRSDSNHPSAAIILTRDSGDTLLNHGDVLQLTPGISILFEAARQHEVPSSGLDPMMQVEVKRFAKQYQVTGRILGSGGNASVFVAVKQSTQRQVACKIVPLSYKKLDALPVAQQLPAIDAKSLELSLVRKRENLAREYNVLKDLNHPNIICLEKVFCASHNIYIFQELITGGDLLSYIEKMGALGEPQTAVIIRQVAKAVEYLHSNQIVHRDIKPENILMTSWREGARIVLTDFGQARTLEDAKTAARSSAVFRMQSVVGTYGYTAPEVHQQPKRDLQKDNGYSKAIDIWSIGCITATLLTNDLIFPDDGQDSSDADLDHVQSLRERFDLTILDTGIGWRSISRKAKSFVRQCLHVDENVRLTAKQALLHEWFTNRHYAAEIEAAYQRAIHDWKPRSEGGNLIEFVDTTNALQVQITPDHAKQLAERTKSRHFPYQEPSKLPSNAFHNNHIHLPPPQQRHTPLPGISEDSEGDISHTPSADGAAGRQSLFASPICVPNSPVGRKHKAQHSFENLSIEDFAPPHTQYSLDRSMPPPPPSWNDSLTQSQLMLDELSPPEYPSPPRGHLASGSATGKKRTSSFANLDPSLDVASHDIAGHATSGTGQRKRVHY
ncbi:hypothetical protein LTR36_008455 [Oleoguttula mirabilis]|uniref:Protein kinase domain-containing protein n=1 Tax=Oleoguttula mirabilis TaxID=1507867 RepID=A0AAV9J7H9_9PEZI|nr:hypothetical protein LTR36_008455 [Oleoguttula mirabilis]